MTNKLVKLKTKKELFGQESAKKDCRDLFQAPSKNWGAVSIVVIGNSMKEDPTDHRAEEDILTNLTNFGQPACRK
jgi:hypothetical protein